MNFNKLIKKNPSGMPKLPDTKEGDGGGGEESLGTKEDVSEKQNKTVVLPAATNTDTQWMLTFTDSFGRKYSRGVSRRWPSQTLAIIHNLRNLSGRRGPRDLFSCAKLKVPFHFCTVPSRHRLSA